AYRRRYDRDMSEDWRDLGPVEELARLPLQQIMLGRTAIALRSLLFFSELGFHFPQFPFIAHSRGWSAEDMENNVGYVQASAELDEASRALVQRADDHAQVLLDHAGEEA